MNSQQTTSFPNDTYVGFQRAEIEQSICDRIEYIAHRFAKRIAITSQGVRITYQVVNQTANRLAHALLHHLGEGPAPVLLLLEHNAPVLMALLGVLKAGKSYVVLEPTLPAARFHTILADLQPRLVVTNNQHWDLAMTLAAEGRGVINLDALDTEVSNENLGLSISPDTVAAIFYTSGSTGRPKGVQRTHRGVLQRIWLETNDYNIQADDKIALLYSCGFGASVTDIFNALLNGATLCLYDFKEGGVTDLTNWLRQEAITLFHLPVALFQQWLDNLNQQEQFLKLRQVTPSGRLYRRDVERCWQHLPMTCRLVQRFASSETGICTRFLIDRQTPLPEPVVPVGYPIADKEILLLNENGQPVTGHGIGEIAVKSRYLSSGYWRNPELTRQKFLPDPEDPQGQIYLTGDLGRQRADGCLEYLGRKDFMVKIRGYRVEPSEVETALFELDIVQQAAVIAHIEADREPCLVAYVVPARQHSPLPSQLYQGLRERVPDYMMPVAFVILDEMPLMPNGKIDRQSLPLPDLSQRLVTNEYIPPGTSTEEKLVEIWEQVLEKQPVGIHDHFFEIGGHSLLATQVIARLQQVFQVPLSFHSLFESPTIADLANQIEAFQWAVQCLSLPLSPDSNDTSVLED